MQINRLIATEYTVSSEKIGPCADGFVFAYLADLHDVCVGPDNSLILDDLAEHAPKAILLGGDMVTAAKTGSRRVYCENAKRLVRELSDIAPVYYSIGNHERRWQNPAGGYRESYAEYRDMLERTGVRILDNRSAMLHIGSDSIRVTGVSIPIAYYRKKKKDFSADIIDALAGPADREHFQILLGHTPAFADVYDAWGADLSLAGHYHGGQVRLPFIGGVITTGFGLLPKYDMGLYRLAHGQMAVSAGLGTHTVPLRINNPPEAVYITLRTA